MIMIENLETFIELHRQGTMAKASTVLRVSQSAVSKRIASVETYYGTKLIERSGRNVTLTADALKLVEKLGPILANLREVMGERKDSSAKRSIVLGVSESILSSWGAAKLENIFRGLDIDVEYHSHRSPLVIEKVESGIYDAGLCSGKISSPRSMVSENLSPEELVLVAKSPEKLGNTGQSRSYSKEILWIEPNSATWKSTRREIEKRNLSPSRELESFFSIGQLSKAGYGVGLVPLGVAEALGFAKNCIRPLNPKLFRPVQLVYKKTKLERPYFREIIKALKRL